MKRIFIGDRVIYEGKEYEVLGFAATKDEYDMPYIEIAWNDYKLSPTGYLAVHQDQLELVR